MKSARLYIVHLVFSLLPPTRCFRLKRDLLRWAGAEVGENVRFASSARFLLTGQLRIGDGTWIGHEVLIVGGEADVTIGANVDVGPRVSIVTGSHELFGVHGRAAGAGFSRPIHIMDGVWIGATATILGGVVVGRSSMIAAGALVHQDVPAGVVVGGVPARQISMIEHGVADERN
jgi:putative colanic acid biosynthesis acetyltransferase WcaF